MSSRFSYLHRSKNSKESKKEHNGAQKALFFMMAFFLILFPRYAPFDGRVEQSDALIQHIFNLYFFIVNQTLGIVHESGHGICYILHCPDFLTAANGTIFQIAFPVGIAYYYLYNKKRFAYYVALFFVGFSLSYTAWYIGTAHKGLFLPASKSFLGVDSKHDFNYILDTIGLLPYDGIISVLVMTGAYLVMIRAVIGMFFEAFETKD